MLGKKKEEERKKERRYGLSRVPKQER